MAPKRLVGRLLLTGVPGWLTDSLIGSIGSDGLHGLSLVRCFVDAAATFDERAFQRSKKLELEFVRGDIRNKAAVEQAVKGIDTIVHSAGILHVHRTGEWYHVNTVGTENVVDLAAQNGVGRLIFISSNAAAGKSNSAQRLLSEADPPRPLSHYGRSKLFAERAVQARANQLQYVILRPCMFYGPPVPRRHVEMYQRIRHGIMPLVGGGSYARSLTHIDNLLQGCRLAMEHPAARNQIYYIADDRVYTTRQVTEEMARALAVTPRFLRLPGVVGTVAYNIDMMLASTGLYWQNMHLMGESNWHVGVSVAKAKQDLGYQPTMEIRAGMEQAIQWCISKGLIDH